MNVLKDRIARALSGGGTPSSDFDLNTDVVLPPDRKLRRAGVLVAVHDIGAAEPQLILTKRSSALKHHPGQIAFPGGKQDETDTDVVHTALREAHEEIGLTQTSVNIIGRLPEHETVTGFQVAPVVGWITGSFVPRPAPEEVAEVFHVPLSHVLDPGNYLVQSRRWRGRWRSYYVVPYGPYYIWGATARMLRTWADLMR